jgi:hypothetical protein
MAKKLATPPTELLRLLAINAYTSYRNTLVGSPAPRGGAPEPLEKVWTLRTLLTGRLHRWHNARFIKVLDEYKF